jgi:hypothetical protein
MSKRRALIVGSSGTVLLFAVLYLLVFSRTKPAEHDPKKHHPPFEEIAAHDEPIRPRPFPKIAGPKPEPTEKWCNRDSDCSTDEACLWDSSALRNRCLSSNCARDTDCRNPSRCLVVQSVGGLGRSLRRCVPPGLRKDGEQCDQLGTNPGDGCQPGLVCSHRQCTKPCESSNRCPDHRVCYVDDLNGPTCSATCDDKMCPEGQHCVTVGHNAICADSFGVDCNKTGCPGGGECVSVLDETSGQAFFECRSACRNDGDCEAGYVCTDRGGPKGQCLRSCETNEDCGQYGLCVTARAGASVKGCFRVSK